MAVDLDLDSRAQAWMRTNAGRYGFAEDTPREPWHWAYKA
jgi:LAS superfamily LD-carboxypeptidase LdcB